MRPLRIGTQESGAADELRAVLRGEVEEPLEVVHGAGRQVVQDEHGGVGRRGTGATAIPGQRSGRSQSRGTAFHVMHV